MLNNGTNIFPRETNPDILELKNSSYALQNNSINEGNNTSYLFGNKSFDSETEYKVTIISLLVTHKIK